MKTERLKLESGWAGTERCAGVEEDAQEKAGGRGAGSQHIRVQVTIYWLGTESAYNALCSVLAEWPTQNSCMYCIIISLVNRDNSLDRKHRLDRMINKQWVDFYGVFILVGRLTCDMLWKFVATVVYCDNFWSLPRCCRTRRGQWRPLVSDSASSATVSTSIAREGAIHSSDKSFVRVCSPVPCMGLA